MFGRKIHIPRDLRGRIRNVAKKHRLGSLRAAADHFIDKGLAAQGAGSGELSQRMAKIVDDRGYADVHELVEHLLRRGLSAYETVDDDPAATEARLRGLGYIE